MTSRSWPTPRSSRATRACGTCIVTVSHGATSDCYQLFIGYRARLPARLRHARIGTHSGSADL